MHLCIHQPFFVLNLLVICAACLLETASLLDKVGLRSAHTLPSLDPLVRLGMLLYTYNKQKNKYRYAKCFIRHCLEDLVTSLRG